MKHLYHITVYIILLAAPFRAAAGLDITVTPGQRPDSDSTSVLLERIGEEPDNEDILVKLCSWYTIMGDFDQCLYFARKLRHVGKSANNAKALLYADFYVGQTYLLTNSGDSVKYYLDNALLRAQESGDVKALSMVHNGLGIYTTGIEMNYRGGINHFLQAIEYAREYPDKKHYLISLCNLAMAYYMRYDPAGLKYSEDVYELGKIEGDEYIVFGGAVISAYLHNMLGDNHKALQYIRETLPLAEKYNYETEVYSIYGNILHSIGDDATAEAYYTRAMDHIGSAVVTAQAIAYLGYASFLIDRGRSGEAIPLLEKGITISQDKNNAVQRYLLYRKMSEALSRQGDYRNALHYFTIYHTEADSIFNIEREYSINELRVKYEAERQENEIRENRMAVMQRDKQLQFTVMLVAILILTSAGIYLLYLRKNKMYRQIVRRQHDFIQKERKLAASVPLAPATAGQKAETGSKDENERDSELFSRLETLMEYEKAYRENDITIDKLADRLGTNRTYLSRTINQQSGKTFNNYINSYRIDEAVRILSDVSSDIPLKALAVSLGYNHLQTFYTAFQSSIGMPPSKYREKLMELYKKNAL